MPDQPRDESADASTPPLPRRPATPAQVRRALADARHDEPMPDDVAARLDAVLGAMASERAGADSDAGPGRDDHPHGPAVAAPPPADASEDDADETTDEQTPAEPVGPIDPSEVPPSAVAPVPVTAEAPAPSDTTAPEAPPVDLGARRRRRLGSMLLAAAVAVVAVGVGSNLIEGGDDSGDQATSGDAASVPDPTLGTGSDSQADAGGLDEESADDGAAEGFDLQGSPDQADPRGDRLTREARVSLNSGVQLRRLSTTAARRAGLAAVTATIDGGSTFRVNPDLDADADLTAAVITAPDPILADGADTLLVDRLVGALSTPGSVRPGPPVCNGAPESGLQVEATYAGDDAVLVIVPGLRTTNLTVLDCADGAILAALAVPGR